MHASNPSKASNARPHHQALLRAHLGRWMPELDAAGLDALATAFDWTELAGGATLMREGEAGDAMYMLVSGRLRAYRHVEPGVWVPADEAARQRAVRDIARGQIVGEMALITGEPRSATLLAVRDSVLARLPRERFEQLLTRSTSLSLAITRQIIQRLRSEGESNPLALPATMGLVPISPGVDARALAQALVAQMARACPGARVRLVDAAAVQEQLGGQPFDGDDAEMQQQLALWLDEIEAASEFVVLLGNAEPDAWTARVCQQSDELLLLADADAPPELHATERAFLARGPGRAEVAQVLVLLHPADRRCPRGTAAWLALRPLAGHCHLRPALERDIARLARIQTRTATGLVLAGGGARGFAHLGVLRALQERGIEIDWLGGTSMGAVMAAAIAIDRPLEETQAALRRAFAINPTGDYSALPIISLVRGRRLKRSVQGAIAELAGGQVDAEDLWKNFFCVATNFSEASELLIDHGPLELAVRASVAIPGALPPVLRQGQLLCDGGTLNNFPTDVMRARRGVGRVIGVDLNFRQPRRFDFDEVPGPLTLLLDRLRPDSRRRFRLPSLATYLMNVTVLYSLSRQRQARAHADLCFNPPLQRVSLLEWKRFDAIVEQGYRHALEVLDAAPWPAAPAAAIVAGAPTSDRATSS
jgi:NTE family protein